MKKIEKNSRGHQGYLGSRLTDYLLKRNYQCFGIDTGFFKNCFVVEPSEIPSINKDARFFKEDDIYGLILSY